MAENKGPQPQPEKPFSLGRETPIVRNSPESLMRQGFSFIGNREADNSLRDTIFDDSYILALIRLKEQGIRTESFDINTCNSLKEYVRESLKDGYETVFLRGTVNPLVEQKKQFTPSRESIAVFRRFYLIAFFSSKSFQELQNEGFALQGYLPFDRWGNALENLKSAHHEKAVQQNTAIEDHIRLHAHHNMQVILVRGTINKDGMHDTSTPMVTTLVRNKRGVIK